MGKRKVLVPLKNDWLFSCPPQFSTPDIVTALEITEQPIIELSAKNWDTLGQMARDIMQAYGYSDEYVSLYKPGKPVNRDGFEDWLSFNGCEIFIIRDCRVEIAESLAFWADVVRRRLIPAYRKLHFYPDTRPAVILAGWMEPGLEARVASHRVAFVVNSLPLS
jgi:hypothetical protein